MIDEILAARDAQPDLPIVLDSETDGLEPWRGDVLRDIQIGIGDRVWHLPMTRPHSDNVDRRDVQKLLTCLGLVSPLWVLFNAKFDYSMIEADLKISTAEWPTWDCATGAWLEDENHPQRDLKGRAAVLGHTAGATEKAAMQRLCDGPTLKTLEDALYAASRLFGARKVTRAQCNALARERPEYGHREMWDLTAEEIHPYAVEDIASTRFLHDYQRSLDHKHPIAAAMPREMAVMRVLMGMERRGIMVDTARATSSRARAMVRLEELGNLFPGVNPGSHDQLAKLVFEDWGFPIFERTPTGAPSTARAALELLGDDPRIVGLLEWRRLQKAVTAYYDPLLDKVDATGRVHPCFRQTGTRTGRFSAGSPGPVLQCIPREDTDSEVRALFRPSPGYALVGFDLAQAEVRWAAALSRDPALIEACRSSDVYSTVAAQMGVDRPHAKQTVLANNYGGEAEQLASTLLKGSGRAVTPDDIRRAAGLKERLRRTYPLMATAADRLEQVARRDGRFPLHPPGRFRHFRGIGHAPEEYRKAWNSACQGGIGELMKDLMIALEREGVWAAHGARCLLQVHDELVSEVPPEEVDSLQRDMQEVLDAINPLPIVRQLVEVKIWKSADDGHVLAVDRRHHGATATRVDAPKGGAHLSPRSDVGTVGGSDTGGQERSASLRRPDLREAGPSLRGDAEGEHSRLHREGPVQDRVEEGRSAPSSEVLGSAGGGTATPLLAGGEGCAAGEGVRDELRPRVQPLPGQEPCMIDPSPSVRRSAVSADSTSSTRWPGTRWPCPS